MEANAKKHLKHLCYFGLATVVVICGVWGHQHDVISSNQKMTIQAQNKAKSYQRDRLGFTTDKLRHKYNVSEPNLGTTLSTNQHDVQKGLQIAFASCRNMKSLNAARPKFSRLLGSDAGNMVYKILQQQVSQVVGTNKHAKQGDKIRLCHVSYGKYDDAEDEVPVEVFVRYTTPVIKDDGGAGGLRPVGKKKVSPIHKGVLVFDGSYSPKTKTLSVDHEHNQLQHES